MQFTPIDIKNCLDTAQNLREVYFHSHHKVDHQHISVNALLNIVQTNYDKKIKLSFHNDSHENHYIHSFLYIESDGSCHICLMSGMTNCWNRFALCKELFHVILDEEKTRNISLQDHVQDFKTAIMDANIGGRESTKIEILTEFAAMQFLFPYTKRLRFDAELVHRIGTGESKRVILKEMAERLRLPRLLTEDYLEKEMLGFFSAIAWNEKSDER